MCVCVCSPFPHTPIIWTVCSSGCTGFWGCDISMSLLTLSAYLWSPTCSHGSPSSALDPHALKKKTHTSRLNLLSGRKPYSFSSVCQSVSLWSKQLAPTSPPVVVGWFVCFSVLIFCFVCIFFLLWISRDDLYFLSMPWIGSVLADQDTDVWAG